MKVILLSPLCSPEYNAQPGETVEVSKALGDAMIEQRTAKPWTDPKAAKKAAAKAAQKALQALGKGLDRDIAEVKAQLKKDSVKPGAVKADLEVAADEAITKLKADHDEATSAL